MFQLLNQGKNERKGREPKFSQNDEFHYVARPRVSLHLAPVDAYSLSAAKLTSVARSVFSSRLRQPLPAYSTAKSPSALSRFLNESSWSTRAVILVIRAYILSGVAGLSPGWMSSLAASDCGFDNFGEAGEIQGVCIVADGVAGQARCAFGCPLPSRWASSASLGLFESIGAKALALRLS